MGRTMLKMDEGVVGDKVAVEETVVVDKEVLVDGQSCI